MTFLLAFMPFAAVLFAVGVAAARREAKRRRTPGGNEGSDKET